MIDKIIKTGIRLFLALLLVMGAGIVISQPAQAAQVVVLSVDAVPGGAIDNALELSQTYATFDVEIFLDQTGNGPEGISGAELYVTYDPAKLQIQGYTPNPTCPLNQILPPVEVLNDQGLFSYAAIKSPPMAPFPTTNFVIVKLTFQPTLSFLADPGATADIDFSRAGDNITECADGNGSAAIASVEKATITSDPNGVKLEVTGIPSPIIAGTSCNVTVTAKQGGITMAGYDGEVQLGSSDVNATLPAHHTFVPGVDDGVFKFEGFAFTAPGTQTVTASDNATPAIRGTSAEITVFPAVEFVVTGITSPRTAGVTTTVTVTAMEEGDIKDTYTGTVKITSSDGEATLPTPYVFTGADNGVHIFTGLILKTAGTHTVTASDNDSPWITGTVSDIIVNPTGASYLKVTGATSSMTAGGENELTVTAYDPYDNVATTTYTGTKSLRFTGPGTIGTYIPKVEGTPIDTYGSFLFTAGATGTGNATLVAYKAETTVEVEVTDGTISSLADPAYDLGLTVNPEAADNLRITGATSMNAGDENELTVTAYDIYGNIATTTYTGTKSLRFSGPSAIGTYIPNVEATDIGDAADFTFTAGATTAGEVTLVAYTAETIEVEVLAATINSTADLAYDLNLTVGPDTASDLKVTVSANGTNSATMTAGGSLEMTVTAYDTYGNVDTVYPSPQNLTFSGPNTIGSYIPKIEGTPIDTARSFSFTAGATTAGGVTLVAYKVESVDIGVSTATINSTADAAYDLALTVDPSTAKTLTVSGIADPIEAGATATVTVTAKDLYSNVATGYTGTIAFTTSDTDTRRALPTTGLIFSTGNQGAKTWTNEVKLYTYGEQWVRATDGKGTVSTLDDITGAQTAITVTPVITTSISLGADWNLFSTPFPLEESGPVGEAGYDTWGQLKNISGTGNVTIACYYDPSYTVSGVSLPWRVVTDSYHVKPCDAFYVNMAAADSISLAANTVMAGPSKQLYAGWNLAALGLYPGPTMQIDEALTPINEVTGGLTGYSVVVSPAGISQAADFIYIRGVTTAVGINLTIGDGYWVFMINPGELAGYTMTPLP